MKPFYESLLEDWCRGLRRLQVRDTGDPRLDGAILCPACGRIHGRCGEAAYPFLKMASLSQDKEPWISAARQVLQWEEHNLRQPDGSLLNDLDVDWKGTTVFYTIQLADCLLFHGCLLNEEERTLWKERLARCGEFLYTFEELRENNINYSIGNALALFLCGQVLDEPRYAGKARELAAMAEERFTENGLLFGEGIPQEKKSPKGCLPVDLGYNMEETLPCLALYGHLSGDQRAMELAEQGLCSHLAFMLPDGGLNNSFGTRCYKWTYWGSRTSDGCALGLLLYGKKEPAFARAAARNLRLLKECTHEGLLYGGPHYLAAGQPPCVHHTFTHAKVLAEIMDRGLGPLLETHTPEERHLRWAMSRRETGPSGNLEKASGRFSVQAYPEIASWRFAGGGWQAFVTAYDWEYMRGGHVSGGTLSLLYGSRAGVILVSAMGEYSRKEPANMQVPRQVREEPLGLRIEAWRDGACFSSIYEDGARCRVKGNCFQAEGYLKDKCHREPEGRIPYRLEYIFEENCVCIRAFCREGTLICPVISAPGERIQRHPGSLVIRRREKGGNTGGRVTVSSPNPMRLPYGTERIFSLAPGLCALRLELAPTEGQAELILTF